MIVQADSRAIPLKDNCVQCVVTSPPYWGLRDYGTARWEGGEAGCDHVQSYNSMQSSKSTLGGRLPENTLDDKRREMHTSYGQECGKCGARRIDSQLGLERTPEEFIANMVAVFREVHRVLKPDGTIWVNMGDSYWASQAKESRLPDEASEAVRGYDGNFQRKLKRNTGIQHEREACGLKPKDLVGIPWKLAFALQADGWYLRSDIIWHKPNPMPESVTDRPTKAHEYLFLLAKGERYFYDAAAIAEPSIRAGEIPGGCYADKPGDGIFVVANRYAAGEVPSNRNRRTVWTIATQPYSGAHFATFPEKLVEPCILAGSRPGDLVFDPFLGSGTVLRVAYRHQRKAVGCDISLKYLKDQAQERSRNVQVNLFV